MKPGEHPTTIKQKKLFAQYPELKRAYDAKQRNKDVIGVSVSIGLTRLFAKEPAFGRAVFKSSQLAGTLAMMPDLRLALVVHPKLREAVAKSPKFRKYLTNNFIKKQNRNYAILEKVADRLMKADSKQ
jgi:hypothetical protein